MSRFNTIRFPAALSEPRRQQPARLAMRMPIAPGAEADETCLPDASERFGIAEHKMFGFSRAVRQRWTVISASAERSIQRPR